MNVSTYAVSSSVINSNIVLNLASFNSYMNSVYVKSYTYNGINESTFRLDENYYWLLSHGVNYIIVDDKYCYYINLMTYVNEHTTSCSITLDVIYTPQKIFNSNLQYLINGGVVTSKLPQNRIKDINYNNVDYSDEVLFEIPNKYLTSTNTQILLNDDFLKNQGKYVNVAYAIVNRNFTQIFNDDTQTTNYNEDSIVKPLYVYFLPFDLDKTNRYVTYFNGVQQGTPTSVADFFNTFTGADSDSANVLEVGVCALPTNLRYAYTKVKAVSSTSDNTYYSVATIKNNEFAYSESYLINFPTNWWQYSYFVRQQYVADNLPLPNFNNLKVKVLTSFNYTFKQYILFENTNLEQGYYLLDVTKETKQPILIDGVARQETINQLTLQTQRKQLDDNFRLNQSRLITDTTLSTIGTLANNVVNYANPMAYLQTANQVSGSVFNVKSLNLRYEQAQENLALNEYNQRFNTSSVIGNNNLGVYEYVGVGTQIVGRKYNLKDSYTNFISTGVSCNESYNRITAVDTYVSIVNATFVNGLTNNITLALSDILSKGVLFTSIQSLYMYLEDNYTETDLPFKQY